MTLKNTCYFTILATILLSSLASPVLLNKASALSVDVGDTGILPPLPIPIPIPIPIPEPEPTTVSLTVQSADLSGATFEGMWIELFLNGQLIDEGFTPFSATLDSGVEYEVVANNFEDITFDHWEDGSTDQTRFFTLMEDDVFTAFYQTDPAPPPTPNNPPVAADDSAQTQVSTPVIIDVLANDSDPDGDTILLDSFNATSKFNGTITRDDNGTPQDQSDDNLVYTPPGTNFGTDTFSYTISDGNGGVASATVTVIVQEPTSS